jgi:hypothetical protein
MRCIVFWAGERELRPCLCDWRVQEDRLRCGVEEWAGSGWGWGWGDREQVIENGMSLSVVWMMGMLPWQG